MFKTKNFREDLDILLNKIKEENIAFSRFGDGEMAIIKRQNINLLNKNTGEFRFCPNEKKYDVPYKLLKKSFTTNIDNYYISISCPCCVGESKHLEMLKDCGLDKQKVTWANLFVNSNYYYFMSNISQFLKDKEVYLISNKNSKIDKMPFKIRKHYPIGADSWLNDIDLIEELKSDISRNNIENSYFLFCAGPLSNIACCELFQYNNNNTYLDCGSVFDVLLGLGKTRGYLRGEKTLQKTCIWSYNENT